MVQWHTQKTTSSKSRHPKTNFNCRSAIYKSTQSISDTFCITKTPENAIFSPQKRSKNTLFVSFFALKHQKSALFDPKNAQKNGIFAGFASRNSKRWHTMEQVI
jgi:hypothetical protein